MSVALVINEMVMKAVKHFKQSSETSQVGIDSFIGVGFYTITLIIPGRLPSYFDFESGVSLGT